MEAFIIDPARLISDIVGYISDLRNVYQSSQQPVTDDETILHKFCVKLETVLRHEQKERYSLLGVRKDYWNFILESIPKDDGVKYVHALPQVKTSQGKGRAFIRYSLVKNSLADAIQRCMVHKKHLSAYYRSEAILLHPSLSTALVNKLYDLNDIEFDLPCAGHELDISWPAFSRRSFVDGQGSVSGRRSSVSSLTSVDLRNERPDPLVGLATEVSSLKAVFPEESPHGKGNDAEVFDNVSIPDSTVEPPSIPEITLEISHLHRKILQWKADLESQLSRASNDVKKAQDDRKFSSQEYELKLKQLNEKYSNLTRAACEESDGKVKGLLTRITTAEEALREREAEVEQLRQEVKVAEGSSKDAQKSSIELERQLTASERKQSELTSECEKLIERLKFKEQIADELETNLLKQKGEVNELELLEAESNKRIAEVEGELKAKEVALERVQESFEKMNGMVFGSFEELEGELKTRLMDRERGLECQSEENRRLARTIAEIEQRNRDLTNKLTDANAKVEQSENENTELQDLIEELTLHKQEYDTFIAHLDETLKPQGSFEEEDGHRIGKERNGVVLMRVKHLVAQMSSLHQQINENNSQQEQLAGHLAELEANIEKKDLEIVALNEEVDSSRRRIEFINEEKGLLEKERIETDNRLVILEQSEQSLKSDISLVVEEKSKALDELTQLQGHHNEQNNLRTGVQDELAALKQQLEETVLSKQKLARDLESITGTLQTIESEKKNLDDQLNALEENMAACQDERSGLEHELDVARQQLETANEARIHAEQGQVKTQAQLESLRCMMDQEVAALKFQLSSETIKYETELKVLSDQTQEYNSVKDRLTEQQELVVDLEARLKERNDAIQHDKHKYVSEIKHLRNEVQHFKSGFDANKLKVRSLENELLLTAKQLEEERSRQRDLKRKAEDFEVEKGLSNKQYEDKIAQLQTDMEEFKQRLVSVTREKADLWVKAHDMEHEIKVKSDDRWMGDSEVTHCLDCNAEFSFLLRKHHCRICGRIFCHNCSNNWVQTPHSRKLRRVCNHCLSADKRLLSQLVGSRRETEDDAKSDISGVDSSHGSESMLGGEDENDRGGLGTGVDTNDGLQDPQPGPSTSTADQLKPRASSSTSTLSLDKKQANEKERSQSVVSGDSSKYTSLKTVKKSKVKPTKLPEQPASDSPEEHEYEFIDPEEEETGEQPEARVVIGENDCKQDLVIPSVNQEPGDFWHVTVPPGRRHVFQILVGTPRASLCWRFTTEKKSILFGVAFKISENKRDQDSETVVPLSRSDSHIHSVKGQIDDVSPGVYLLVFDNTFSRLTSKRLYCVVQVKRRENDDEDDSLT